MAVYTFNPTSMCGYASVRACFYFDKWKTPKIEETQNQPNRKMLEMLIIRE